MTLDPITSDLLSPVAHGFFTRQGGASSGIFEGLNCGLGSSDLREAVMLNRTRVADAMGADSLVRMHQIHSAEVAVIDAPQAADDAAPRADALVTATPGLVLSVLTADCQPVLFADPEAGVVAAAHAGWRGTLDGVLDATVDTMESLGAKRDQIRAVIGPSISQPAYEVGPEFHADFTGTKTPNSPASLLQAKGTVSCLTFRALALPVCAHWGSKPRNGRATAPMQTRPCSIRTAAPPMRARPTMAVWWPASAFKPDRACPRVGPVLGLCWPCLGPVSTLLRVHWPPPDHRGARRITCKVKAAHRYSITSQYGAERTCSRISCHIPTAGCPHCRHSKNNITVNI